jgi:D-aminoacyl-tRNA deacylase
MTNTEKIAIIAATTDPAGMNIKECLLRMYDFKELEEQFEGSAVFQLDNIKLYTADKESVYCEDIDKKIDADFFVFATKHRSESGIDSLSVHSPGNWGEAGLGGRDKKLCIAPARHLRTAFFKLEELAKGLDFEIVQECTHHGPYLEKPVMFIEIGSNEKAWVRKDAGEIIAKTIMFLLKTEIPEFKIAFGIGGLHHTPSFTSVMRKSDYCFGHVCPKYALENLTKELAQQAMEKSNAEIVILDWKGLGQFKEKIKEILDETGLKSKRTKEFSKD